MLRKLSKYSKFSKALALLILLTNLYWIAGVILDFKRFPFNIVNHRINAFGEAVTFQLKGEDYYIEKVLASQMATTSGIRKGKKLETVDLKINRSYFSLTDFGVAQEKGAIEIIDGKVFFMDRLGRLFVVQNDSLVNISINLPNNLNGYILSCREEKGSYQLNGRPKVLNAENFIAHNLVYDSLQSRIIFSFQRYDETDNTSILTVAALPFDIEKLIPTGNWTTIVDGLRAVGLGGGEMIIKNESLFLSTGYIPKEKNGAFSSLLDDSEYGKIFKINLNTNESVVFSKGHRNASGMALSLNGELLVTEHGPQGGDEINIVREGDNLGWPIQTYGTRYGTYDHHFSQKPQHLVEDAKAPFFSFVPSIAISSVLQVSDFHPAWDNDLLIGSLKAQTLYRLKIDEGKVIFCEPIWLGHRIRNIMMLDGKIILLTDDAYLITLSSNSEIENS